VLRLYARTPPNARKVSIAIEELGGLYAVRPVHLGTNEAPEPDFLVLNPNHKIPVLTDDDLLIRAADRISLYLAEISDKLLPPDSKVRIAAIESAFLRPGAIGPNLGRIGTQRRRPEGERHREIVQIFGDEVKGRLGVLHAAFSTDGSRSRATTRSATSCTIAGCGHCEDATLGWGRSSLGSWHDSTGAARALQCSGE